MVATKIAIFVILTLLSSSSSSVEAFQPAPSSSCTVPTSSSLDAVSRREALTVASSTAASIVVAGGSAVPNAQAAAGGKSKDAPDVKKFAFNGIYKDPKHPTGFRIIAGAPNKGGTMTLQDSPDGAIFNIPIKASTDETTGSTSLLIDFSEKGGPSNTVATVNKKDSSIVFPDGNIWKKDTSGLVGVYVDGFAPYPKFRRIIREVDNNKKGELVVCMVSGKTSFVVSGQAGIGNVYIDFPGNKPCTGKVNTKKGTILWPDGNVWTRV